jgi:hypothetical protein
MVQRPLVQLLRYIKTLIWHGSDATFGMKLVLDQEARREVRRRSLACFTRKLDQLVHVENAVLITASVLNDPVRGDRLQQRILEIEKRPEWRYQLIERKLEFLEAAFGRLFYGWQLPHGSGVFRAYVPGLIAWRKSDTMPDLKKIKSRRPEIYGLDSLKAKASTTSAMTPICGAHE